MHMSNDDKLHYHPRTKTIYKWSAVTLNTYVFAYYGILYTSHTSLQLSSFNRGPHLNFFIVPFLQVSCFRKTKARKTARLKISVSRPLMSWFARSNKNWDFSNFSKFLEKSQTVCRNRSFCWAPLYLLILAKSAISPIFRNFWRNRSFCWTTFYLLYHLT